MNLKLGLWSSTTLTIAVVLFAVMMLARLDYGAYAMSMLISWAYVVLACSFSATARPDEAAAAQTGVAFGGAVCRVRNDSLFCSTDDRPPSQRRARHHEAPDLSGVGQSHVQHRPAWLWPDVRLHDLCRPNIGRSRQARAMAQVPSHRAWRVRTDVHSASDCECVRNDAENGWRCRRHRGVVVLVRLLYSSRHPGCLPLRRNAQAFGVHAAA